MADIEEVYVNDLYKKHNGKELFKWFSSIGMKTYQDDGEVINEGFGLDREALEVLSAKIMVILMDEYPTKGKEFNNNNSTKESDRQNFSIKILLNLKVLINNSYY